MYLVLVSLLLDQLKVGHAHRRKASVRQVMSDSCCWLKNKTFALIGSSMLHVHCSRLLTDSRVQKTESGDYQNGEITMRQAQIIVFYVAYRLKSERPDDTSSCEFFLEDL